MQAVQLLRNDHHDEYARLAEYVETLAAFLWRCLSAATDRDCLVRDEVLPTVRAHAARGLGPMPLHRLAERLEWEARHEERHGPLPQFLEEFHAEVELDVLGAHVRAKRAFEDVAGPALVERNGGAFIAEAFLGPLRQQLSRSARHENQTLDWRPEEGLNSAFAAFPARALDAAAEWLFRLQCPADPGADDWAPRALRGDGAPPASRDYATYAVLFLAVQQFAENLRQSGHFKRRTWQYLAAALPDFDPEAPLDAAAPAFCEFQHRCRGVGALLRYLLTLVGKDVINYADVDDIFERTTVAPPDAARAHRLPNYRAPRPQPRVALVIPQRRLPAVHDYGDLIPSRSAEGNARLVSALSKTYAERVSVLTMLRLFFFVVHAHVALFLGLYPPETASQLLFQPPNTPSAATLEAPHQPPPPPLWREPDLPPHVWREMGQGNGRGKWRGGNRRRHLSTAIQNASCQPPLCEVRLVVASLRGPGRPPVLPFACCVGSLRFVGRCGRCSCWCLFRVRGAQ